MAGEVNIVRYKDNEVRVPLPRHCYYEFCARPFDASKFKPAQRFCSDECRIAAHVARRPPLEVKRQACKRAKRSYRARIEAARRYCREYYQRNRQEILDHKKLKRNAA